jgi:hypothetical protein
MYLNETWKNYLNKHPLKKCLHLPKSVTRFLNELHFEKITFQNVEKKSYEIEFVLTHQQQIFTFVVEESILLDSEVSFFHTPYSTRALKHSLFQFVSSGFQAKKIALPNMWDLPPCMDITWNNHPFKLTLQEYLQINRDSYDEVLLLFESFDFKKEALNGLLQDYLSTKKVA